jgi:hypothetical protein
MVLEGKLASHAIVDFTWQKLTILVFSSSAFAEDIALLKPAIPWVSLFEAARTVSSVPVNLQISSNKNLTRTIHYCQWTMKLGMIQLSWY